jgi:hypothetical protein
MRLRLLSLVALLFAWPAFATDDETTRLEAAALCKAMPYSCPQGPPGFQVETSPALAPGILALKQKAPPEARTGAGALGKKTTTISVVGGLCNCGQGAGGFDATYQGRQIDVHFDFGSREWKGVIVRRNKKLVPPPEALTLICSWAMELQACPITGSSASIVGSWDTDTKFYAAEVGLPALQTVKNLGQPKQQRAKATLSQPLGTTVPPPSPALFVREMVCDAYGQQGALLAEARDHGMSLAKALTLTRESLAEALVKDLYEARVRTTPREAERLISALCMTRGVDAVAPHSGVPEPVRASPPALGITPAGFAAITMGMPYAEVCRILGPPTRTLTETVSTWIPSSAVHVWALLDAAGWDRASISVFFEGDKVYQKRQHGLR